MTATALMIQGTASHVGKSLVTATLCRILAQQGVRVVPFKAQNMSNNAAVTPDGGEISRAQAEQAAACGVEPSVLMNPVLLKPTTDVGASVIVLGRAIGTMTATEYQAYKPQLRATILEALRTLMAQAEVVVIEGAGSPAEINLKEHDLANMWVATAAGAAVWLVGDIDRGGVFAHFAGTMELLPPDERALVRGFVINKFRGDPALLTSGIRWLEDRYGVPVVGTIPYLDDVGLAEEDLLPEPSPHAAAGDGDLRIDVLRLPRISNVSDVDPLKREPGVVVRFIDRPSAEPLPHCVIIPGSKSTIADLAFLRARGLDRYLQRCADAGTEIVGLCGGFQMLGERIRDPDLAEAAVPEAPGLGWLPTVTVFEREKTVARVRAIHLESGLPVTGYEIHMGRMQSVAGATPVLQLTERNGQPAEQPDGVRHPSKPIWGTHVHGLFDEDPFRHWWLAQLRRRCGVPDVAASPTSPEDRYDRLAAAVRPHLDLTALAQLIRRPLVHA